jgi:hypothetical protein
VSPKRQLLLGLLAGVVHAAVLVGVALRLGYTVGPTAYTPLGIAWRYGGLVVVAALPTWLALRYRLVLPFLALNVTTGYVLGVELSPPGPTFRDLAELERLAEPTGIVVVEDGLYIVRYMVNASVWGVGFLLAGLVEHVVRTTWPLLPGVRGPSRWLSVPASRRRAAVVATVGGILHALAMTWFAYRLGLAVSDGGHWTLALLYLYGAAGMWLLAAVPTYLLVRHRLVGPAVGLALFVLQDVNAEFSASVDSPHALYFGAWFVFLGLLLVVAGVEYGLRRLGGDAQLLSA